MALCDFSSSSSSFPSPSPAARKVKRDKGGKKRRGRREEAGDGGGWTPVDRSYFPISTETYPPPANPVPLRNHPLCYPATVFEFQRVELGRKRSEPASERARRTSTEPGLCIPGDGQWCVRPARGYPGGCDRRAPRHTIPHHTTSHHPSLYLDGISRFSSLYMCLCTYTCVGYIHRIHTNTHCICVHMYATCIYPLYRTNIYIYIYFL